MSTATSSSRELFDDAEREFDAARSGRDKGKWLRVIGTFNKCIAKRHQELRNGDVSTGCCDGTDDITHSAGGELIADDVAADMHDARIGRAYSRLAVCFTMLEEASPADDPAPLEVRSARSARRAVALLRFAVNGGGGGGGGDDDGGDGDGDVDDGDVDDDDNALFLAIALQMCARHALFAGAFHDAECHAREAVEMHDELVARSSWRNAAAERGTSRRTAGQRRQQQRQRQRSEFHAWAHFYYANCHACFDRHGDALAQYELAVRLAREAAAAASDSDVATATTTTTTAAVDPIAFARVLDVLADCLFRQRRLAEALACAQEALRLMESISREASRECCTMARMLRGATQSRVAHLMLAIGGPQQNNNQNIDAARTLARAAAKELLASFAEHHPPGIVLKQKVHMSTFVHVCIAGMLHCAHTLIDGNNSNNDEDIALGEELIDAAFCGVRAAPPAPRYRALRIHGAWLCAMPGAGANAALQRRGRALLAEAAALEGAVAEAERAGQHNARVFEAARNVQWSGKFAAHNNGSDSNSSDAMAMAGNNNLIIHSNDAPVPVAVAAAAATTDTASIITGGSTLSSLRPDAAAARMNAAVADLADDFEDQED